MSAAYGGFWIRLLAALIDTILFMLVEAPFVLLAYGPGYYSLDSTQLIHGWVDVLVTIVMPFVATILFWRWRRATPGKMLLKLEVVDGDTGETPSVGQCVLRYVGYFLAAVPCGLGLLFIFFDKRKRGWHDRLANTVVRRR
jgi:uncharacterized RDD family membrane protein YckC